MDFLTCLLIDCAKKTKHKLTQDLKKYNITCRQAVVLRGLDKLNISAKEIGKATSIDKATLSVMLKKLIEHGLIDYIVSKTDGREKNYSLTKKGQDLLPIIRTIDQQFKEKVFSSLSKEEYNNLSIYLSKIKKNI